MVTDRQCTDRIVVSARVSIKGATPDDAANITTSEAEAIAQALRELAEGYEQLAAAAAKKTVSRS